MLGEIPQAGIRLKRILNDADNGLWAFYAYMDLSNKP